MKHKAPALTNTLEKEPWYEWDVDSPSFPPPLPTKVPTVADDLSLPVSRDSTGSLVSVVVPTYRDEEYLPTALESIGAQTHQAIEIIIVDSSGVDWIEELAESRRWIKYIALGPSGVSAARNAGVSAATGEYVAFLDADDYWHPEKLERQLEGLEPGHNISFSAYYFIDYWRAGDPTVTVTDTQQIDPSTVYQDVITRQIDSHISTLVCRRSILANDPFNEAIDNFEDVVFAVDHLANNAPFHIRDPLAVRRLRPQSLAHRTPTVEKSTHRISGYRQLLHEHPDQHSLIHRMIASEYYRSGIDRLQTNQKSEARRYFVASLRHDASMIRTYVLLCATVIPFDGSRSFSWLESLSNRLT